MPIYEYQCGACDKTFEEWQKISEPPVKKCPSCGAKKVSRLISQTSFQLKGSGWYVSEYGKGGVKPDTQPKEPSTGGEEIKAPETKAESKASEAAGEQKASEAATKKSDAATRSINLKDKAARKKAEGGGGPEPYKRKASAK